MDLSIVIVNWNTKTHLKWCLHYIYRRTENIDFEVFVVDNASSDGSAEMVEKNFTEVKLIKNKKNLGFARANNKAIKRARGKYILLLNADTKILDGALVKMVDFMDSNKDCGVMGPKLLNPDESLQPSVRTFPTLASQVIILLKLHNIFSNIGPIKNYYMFDFNYEKQSDVDQVMGAAFMTRKGVIEKIGPLDEGYFIWFEEVDFCKRVKDKGMRVSYYPGAEIIHEKAASFDQVLGFKKQKMLNMSMLRYFKKHKSFISYIILLFFTPLSLILAWLVQLASTSKSTENKKKL